MSIPKKAHLVWNHKNVINSNHPLITNGIRKLISLNPDWNVTVYDDHDIDEYLKSILDNSDYNLIKDVHIVEKSDLWRQFKLYNEGGLYMDIDRFYNIPLSEILTDGIKCVLPTCLDWDFSQDFMLTESKNPIQAKTIELILQRRHEGHKSVFFLGPQTYMHAVTYTLLGEIVDTNPGADTMDRIRNKISELPFVKTYREVPPNDTIVYKGDIGDELEVQKRDFYAKEGVKHWTGEW
jgi:mannosyltransferase OCH1-like enzyme